MEFLPTNLGTRPGLACEVRPEGVVAARAENGAGLITAVAGVPLREGQVTPGLHAANIADRPSVVAAVRQALESVMLRDRQATLVLPDSAVRVSLLDFDSLPGKYAEALPIVRFRLKKLLPFDAEDAVVSFQIMTSSKGLVRVLAVAVPRDVLKEYEGLMREAGFEPGAVLPSTLAALGAVDEADNAVLVVNAGQTSVTTAIVRGIVVLLHRSVDMQIDVGTEVAAGLLPTQLAPHQLGATAREVAQAVSVAAAYFEDTLGSTPRVIVSAGPTGADTLGEYLADAGIADVTMRELVEPAVLLAGASTTTVPRGWLAGVRGALRS